jgi:hypothetical protein
LSRNFPKGRFALFGLRFMPARRAAGATQRALGKLKSFF